MVSQYGGVLEALRWMAGCPVAWIAIAMDYHPRDWLGVGGLLLPQLAMLISFVAFAKQNRLTLRLTSIVLASFSALQALIFLAMLRGND